MISHRTQRYRAIQFRFYQTESVFPEIISQTAPSEKTAKHQGPQCDPTRHSSKNARSSLRDSKMCCCNLSHTNRSRHKKSSATLAHQIELYFYAKHKNTASIHRSHADPIRFSDRNTTHFLASCPRFRSDRITPAKTEQKATNCLNNRSREWSFESHLHTSFDACYVRLSSPLHIFYRHTPYKKWG